MAFLTNAQKIDLEGYYGVVLARGRDMNGALFYAYILADKDAIERMHKDFQDSRKEVNFAGYGRILAYGPGEDPPAEVTDYIKEKYGIKE